MCMCVFSYNIRRKYNVIERKRKRERERERERRDSRREGAYEWGRGIDSGKRGREERGENMGDGRRERQGVEREIRG